MSGVPAAEEEAAAEAEEYEEDLEEEEEFEEEELEEELDAHADEDPDYDSDEEEVYSDEEPPLSTPVIRSRSVSIASGPGVLLHPIQEGVDESASSSASAGGIDDGGRRESGGKQYRVGLHSLETEVIAAGTIALSAVEAQQTLRGGEHPGVAPFFWATTNEPLRPLDGGDGSSSSTWGKERGTGGGYYFEAEVQHLHDADAGLEDDWSSLGVGFWAPTPGRFLRNELWFFTRGFFAVYVDVGYYF